MDLTNRMPVRVPMRPDARAIRASASARSRTVAANGSPGLQRSITFATRSALACPWSLKAQHTASGRSRYRSTTSGRFAARRRVISRANNSTSSAWR
jgi:hypothetical protein